MRISELARRSGMPVPTIKYYLHAGLLPPGQAIGRNQARYDETHLRRLHLIRTLMDIGGLSVLDARTVLTAIESRAPVSVVLAALDARFAARRDRDRDSDRERDREAATRERVAEVVTQRGWWTHPGSAALDRIADACALARLLDLQELCAALDQYADVAAHVAECDAAVLRALAGRLADAPGDHHDLRLEAMVIVTVLGDAIQHTMSWLARESRVAPPRQEESRDQ